MTAINFEREKPAEAYSGVSRGGKKSKRLKIKKQMRKTHKRKMLKNCKSQNMREKKPKNMSFSPLDI